MVTVNYKTDDYTFVVLHNNEPVFGISKSLSGSEIIMRHLDNNIAINGSPTLLLELRKWLNEIIA